MLIVNLEELEVDARDLEANLNEVIKRLQRLHAQVLKRVGQNLDLLDHLCLDFLLLNELSALLLLFTLQRSF